MAFLSKEEERDLIEKAWKGDMAAREEIILKNTRFVRSLARRYAGLGVPLDDLVQEGCLFMMRSFDYYDPDRPTRFKTLAWWWVRRGILECLSRNDVVRPPSKGYRADDPKKGGCTSLDVVNDQGSTMAASLIDHTAEDAASVAIRRDEKRRVHMALKKLPTRKRHALKMRFGIGIYKEPMSLGEIGDEFGISAERARQIVASAMKDFRIRLARTA